MERYVMENKMNEIKTEEDAYWLGFLYADGCVVEGRHRVNLQLKEEDIEHVQNFKDYLKTDRPIKIKSSTLSNGKTYLRCLLQVDNKEFHSNLIKHGCIPNKTKNEIRLPNIKNELIRHFIRGFFDGDGCVYDRKTNLSITIIGQWNILNDFKNNLPVECSIIQDKRFENIFNLQIHSQESIKKIYEFFYTNSHVWLKRKKDHFDNSFNDKKIKLKSKEDDKINLFNTRKSDILKLKEENFNVKEICEKLQFSKTLYYSVMNKLL